MTRPPEHIVLYADDDPDDLALVMEAFQEYANNVKVITAADGGQAIAYLKRFEEKQTAPCLVILDVNMPVMNGREVLEKLRQMDYFSATPVVLFTTSSSPVDKHTASRFNAGFITKPLNMQQMELIAEQFIEQCSDEIKKMISKKFLP
jgi:CheY-like chemotaxis protein